MTYLDFPVRVRYAETDQMGISYHANYFIWFEAARAELFREMRLPYTQFEEAGIFLPVIDAYCKYMGPSRYDELIYIRVSISQLKLSTMKFTYQALNDSKTQILAWGYTTHVFIGRNRSKVPIPEMVKEKATFFSLQENLIETNG